MKCSIPFVVELMLYLSNLLLCTSLVVSFLCAVVAWVRRRCVAAIFVVRDISTLPIFV